MFLKVKRHRVGLGVGGAIERGMGKGDSNWEGRRKG